MHYDVNQHKEPDNYFVTSRNGCVVLIDFLEIKQPGVMFIFSFL